MVAGGQYLSVPIYIYDISFALPTPSPGELIGRAALSDNNSPFPRDRVFFDFNYFHNAVIGPADLPLHRFTPGFEKTFLGGDASFEFRLPMAVTLSSDLEFESTDFMRYEIGDALFALKGMLFADAKRVVTAGLGVSVPTAQDFDVRLTNGTEIFKIQNQTVRLQPYLAMAFTPNQNYFFQMFASVDTDVSGNSVFYNAEGLRNQTGGNLTFEGRAQATTIAKLDLTAGRWLFRNRNARISDLAIVQEVHLSGDVTDPDSINTDNLQFGVTERAFIANLTTGMHFFFGQQNNITVGYGVPVTQDRAFDGELRVFWNRFF